MPKVLITGALGYIGGHTAQWFKEEGYTVIGVDRMATIPEAAKFLDQLLYDDYATIAATGAAENSVDCIVHCAGSSLVGPSIKDPYTYFDNNVSKTNIFLQDLHNYGWQGSVVFSSSAAVYGQPDISPIPETAPLNPISPYGDSKMFCERVLQRHCIAHNLRGVSLRYFNAAGCSSKGTIGHRYDDTHLIPCILRAYKNSETFVINGDDYNTDDGTCVRDYLHVDDIASAHLAAVKYLSGRGEGHYSAFNLGTGRGYSNLEIVNTAELIIGDSIKYDFGTRRIGDPDWLIAAVGGFTSVSGWKPRSSDIGTIIETAWKWHQNLI